MNYIDIFAASSIVWPLTVILLSLVILRRIEDDIRPIFLGMTGTLKVQSTKYAITWAVVLMSAVMASLQALGEIASAHHWIYVADLVKFVGPGLSVLIVSAKMAPKDPAPTGTTIPPFSPPSQ